MALSGPSWPGLVPDQLSLVFGISSIFSSPQSSLCLHLFRKMGFSVAIQHC